MSGIALDPALKRRLAPRRRLIGVAVMAAMFCTIGVAAFLSAQSQMTVGHQPPPPSPVPPAAYTPYAYPYPYGLPLPPKKKKDRCAHAETPYERNLCEDEITPTQKARCDTDKSPCRG